jgi:hypothetical protein
MMFQLRKPNVIPINDHVWLLDNKVPGSFSVLRATLKLWKISLRYGKLSNAVSVSR